MKYLILLLLFVSSEAVAEFRHFNEWTAKEKALFLTYNTVAFIDHRQTRAALKDPCNCYEESNPLYGTNPHKDKAILLNLAVSGLIYHSIGKYEKDSLNPFILGGILSRTAVVIHNDSIGISWKVAF